MFPNQPATTWAGIRADRSVCAEARKACHSDESAWPQPVRIRLLRKVVWVDEDDGLDLFEILSQGVLGESRDTEVEAIRLWFFGLDRQGLEVPLGNRRSLVIRDAAYPQLLRRKIPGDVDGHPGAAELRRRLPPGVTA